MSFETSALLVTWLAIVLLAFVVASLVRQVHALASGRVHPRANEVGLRKGRPAPDHGRLTHGHEGELLLLFLSDGCGICDEVLDEAELAAAASPTRDLGIRVLFPASRQGRAATALAQRPGGLIQLDQETRLFDEYRVPATPFAVTIDADGRILRSDPVGSRQAARQLIERTAAPAESTQPTPFG